MFFRRLIAALAAGALPLIAAGAPDHLRWQHYEAPDFPPSLVHTTVRSGSATLAFTFDDDGRLTDRLVLAATHPAFSAAVLEAAISWQVDTTGLRASLRRETLRFEFERRGAVINLSQRDATKTAFTPYGDEAATALTTCGEAEIDAPLRAVATPLPPFPPEVKDRVREATVTLAFVIDGTGRVRVPAITAATQPEFAIAALAAARHWSFAPARRDGRIVQVMAERTLRFRRAETGP